MTLPSRSLGDVNHVSDHNALHVRYGNSVEIRSGTEASSPLATAVDAGTLYWATDTKKLYRSNGTAWEQLTAGVSDHGALTGLGDDDHPQYATDTDLTTHAASNHVTNGNSHDHAGGDGAQVDHGGLAGLADDDHTQYLTTARHAAVDAADHGSGAATDGYVLTADGAGGAAWEAAAGGVSAKALWTPGPHPYRAGAWYPAFDTDAHQTGSPQASQVFFAGPFYVTQALNVDAVGANVSSGGSGNARGAIYSSDVNGRPGSLVVESASTAMPASGDLVMTFTSTQLVANTLYWLAYQDDSSPTLYCYGFSSSFLVPHVGFGNPLGSSFRWYRHAQTFGAFPSTPTLVLDASGNPLPALFVRTV